MRSDVTPAAGRNNAASFRARGRRPAPPCPAPLYTLPRPAPPRPHAPTPQTGGILSCGRCFTHLSWVYEASQRNSKSMNDPLLPLPLTGYRWSCNEGESYNANDGRNLCSGVTYSDQSSGLSNAGRGCGNKGVLCWGPQGAARRGVVGICLPLVASRS